jgi:hypothetical protein
MANVSVTFDFAAESAKLRSEIDKVRRELSGIRQSADSIKEGFKTLGGIVAGAFSIGAVTAFLSKVNQAADQLNDLSGRLGASAANLQVLQLAAQQAGGSAEAMNTALAKMSVTLGDAMAGGKAANEALSRLGLTAQELAGLKADEAMRRIAGALSQVGNTYDRAAIAQAVFGKGAKELAQFFAEAPEAIRQTEEALAAAGAALDDIDIARIGVMNDTLAVQSTIVQNLGIKFLSGLTPGIMAATDAFANLMTSMGGATAAGQKFGAVVIAAVRGVEFAIASVSGSIEFMRALWLDFYAKISKDVAALLRLLEKAASAVGANGIAASIETAAKSADTMSASYQRLASSAWDAWGSAAKAAQAAAADILNPEQVYTRYSAMLDKLTQDALRRTQELQGAGLSARGAAGAGAGAAADRARGGFSVEGSLQGAGREIDRALDVMSDPKLLREIEINSALQAIQDEHNQTMLGKIELFEQTRLGSLLSYNDLMINAEMAKNMTLGEMAFDLVRMAAQSSGALGKVGKAFAVAQTIWSTGTAIMRAYEQLGPIKGTVAAAAIAAKGAMHLANIKKTNIGTGGSLAGVGGGGITAAAPALGDNVSGVQQQDQRAISQVVINGNVFSSQETAEWIIGQIRDAVESRDVVFISSNSRQAMELAGA